VHVLERALLEPPTPDVRAAILVELGSAEALIAAPRAAERFEEALSLIDDPAEYAGVALALGRVLTRADRGPEAIEWLDRGIARLGDAEPELILRLEAEVIAAAHNNTSSYALVPERMYPITHALTGRTAPTECGQNVIHHRST